jgi:hypothetical protein
LLRDDLQSAGKTEVNICGTAGLRDCGTAGLRDCGTALKTHPYLCQSQKSRGDFFVCSWFPSGVFTDGGCFACDASNLSGDAEHIEFYPISAFVDFLFSPIGQDDRATKVAILERMRVYFNASIYRRIYFVSSHLHSRLKDPCMGVEPEAGRVTLLFPEGAGNVTHVELNNRHFSTLLQKHYYQDIDLVRDAFSLLDIAHETLVTEHADTWAELRFFYRQCVQRTRYGAWIRECFNPDVQVLLRE